MSTQSPADGDPQFDELRQLLLGPELKKLEQLRERLETPEQFSSEVSDVLPQAMLKSAEHGEQLSEAMVPTVEEIVRLSIKRDINKFASALFPVIGPAIRKSIAETIRQMLRSLNQVLEHGLSWQGIKWRIESMRTGIPFAQIVMLNSLEFRVEQVFLIHRETGILLNHVEQQDSSSQNADMVSSMLTAIGDFVGDSFDVENRQDLDSIQVGDFSILIEQSPTVILALASRGNPPNSLRDIMLQTLEDIQTQFNQELESFNGDTQVFEPCRGQLLLCMAQSQHKPSQRKLSLKAKLIWIIIFILFFYWIFSKIYLSMQQQDYIELLQQEPGFIITQVVKDGDSLTIKGLKDPLARNPQKFIALTTLNTDDISLKFSAYHSLQKEFVEQRAEKILAPPKNIWMNLQGDDLIIKGFASEDMIQRFSMMAPLIAGINSVDLSEVKTSIDLSTLNAPETIKFIVDIDNGHLSSSGTAQMSWASFARNQVASIEGILSYDDSQVKKSFDLSVLEAPDTVTLKLKNKQLIVSGIADSDWIESMKSKVGLYTEINNVDIRQLQNSDEEQLKTAIESLQQENIFFDAALAFNLDAIESLNRVTNLVKTVIDNANKLSRPVKIILQGHSDSVGQFQDNVYLSLDRADYVAQQLFITGISPKYIIIKGIDAPVKKETSIAEQRYNRRVSFTVNIDPGVN